MRSGVRSIAIGWRSSDKPRAARFTARLRSKRARNASFSSGARDGAVGTAPERQIEHGAGLERIERHRARDQIGGAQGIAAPDAGALQRVAKGIAVTQRRGQLDDRALGRFGQRADEIARRHPSPGRRAERDRRDRERARLLVVAAGERRGDGAGQRMQAGREQPGGGAQGDTGGKAAPPGARADLRAEIGHPIDPLHADPQTIVRPEIRDRDERAAERARTRGAGQFQSRLLAQEHYGTKRPQTLVVADPPAQVKSL